MGVEYFTPLQEVMVQCYGSALQGYVHIRDNANMDDDELKQTEHPIETNIICKAENGKSSPVFSRVLKMGSSFFQAQGKPSHTLFQSSPAFGKYYLFETQERIRELRQRSRTLW